MLYKQKSFSVPAVGNPDPTIPCEHGWANKGKCIFCGTQLVVIKTVEETTSQGKPSCMPEDNHP